MGAIIYYIGRFTRINKFGLCLKVVTALPEFLIADQVSFMSIILTTPFLDYF